MSPVLDSRKCRISEKTRFNTYNIVKRAYKKIIFSFKIKLIAKYFRVKRECFYEIRSIKYGKYNC